MLNSDSESVLLKGLRQFALQIRREHGLILPPRPASARQGSHIGAQSGEYGGDRTGNGGGVGLGAGAGARARASARARADATTDEMDVGKDFEEEEEGGTDEEEGDGMDTAADGSGELETADTCHQGDGKGPEAAVINAGGGGRGQEDGEGQAAARLVESSRAALDAAVEAGEPAGLLGDYLRGSPQLSDLFAVWELDVRKVGSG